jgi:menaquinone-dependent protoporphyrinogen oxidase
VRVLVTAASRHGATHEIADAIASGLVRRDIEAEVQHAEQLSGLDGYDAFVIGSAVYVGRWLAPARDLVEAHADVLTARPVWLFSSGPLGPPEALKPEGDPVDADDVIEAAGALAHRVFAGRLDRSLLGLGEKAVVIAVRAPEGDFRDWEAIDAFAAEIAQQLSTGAIRDPDLSARVSSPRS